MKLTLRDGNVPDPDAPRLAGELEAAFYHRPGAEVVEESRSAMQAARLC